MLLAIFAVVAVIFAALFIPTALATRFPGLFEGLILPRGRRVVTTVLLRKHAGLLLAVLGGLLPVAEVRAATERRLIMQEAGAYADPASAFVLLAVIGGGRQLRTTPGAPVEPPPPAGDYRGTQFAFTTPLRWDNGQPITLTADGYLLGDPHDTERPDFSGATVHTPADSAALAALLANPVLATGLHDIRLNPSVIYTGRFSYAHAATGHVLLRTSGFLGTQGVQVSRSAQLAVMYTANSGGGQTGEGGALRVENGAQNLWIEGIDFQKHPSRTDGGEYTTLVSVSNLAAPTLADVPKNIVLSHVRMLDQRMHRCVYMGVDGGAVLDSQLENGVSGYESQAIVAWRGGRKVVIRNNYLSSYTQHIMLGGSGAGHEDLVPQSWVIANNHMTTSLAARALGVAVKAAFEIKNAHTVIVYGNRIEGTYRGGQNGYPLMYMGGGADQMNTNGIDGGYCRNIHTAFNYLSYNGGMLNVGPSTSSGARLGRLHFFDNVSDRVLELTGLPEWADAGDGWNIIIQGGYRTVNGQSVLVAHADFIFEHNTVVGQFSQQGVLLEGTEVISAGFIFRNNIVQHGQYGGLWSSEGGGTAALTNNIPSWNVNGQVEGNVFVGENDGRAVPAGNDRGIAQAAVGFVNPGAYDWTLAAGSSYKGTGDPLTSFSTDGDDVGAYIPLVDAIADTIPAFGAA